MAGTTENLDSLQTSDRPNKTVGCVTVNDTKYAVGLMWAPIQNQDDAIPEIREAMESEPGADLYCQRISTTPQYGLGKTSMGHYSGEPALAASVATALSSKTSACCIFKVPEGWWFVAIRNDLILAEEDVLFETEDEAKRTFFAMMAVPDWDIKIVPAEWGVEGSVQQELKSLIANVRKTRLFELSAAKRTQILVFLAIGVIAALGFLLYLAFSFLISVFEPEEIITLPKPDVVRPIEPEPEKPKPWERMPETNAFLSRCWNNAYQLSSVVIPNWKIGKIDCTPTGLTTNWSITNERGARLAWLKAALEEYQMTKVNISQDSSGTAASASITYSDIPLIVSLPSLTTSQIKEQLTDIKQATGLPLQFSEQTVKDPPDNPDGTAPLNQTVYRYYTISVSSPYSPWEWKTFFDKFSGLEFVKISYDPSIGSKNKWTYEGRIYAK